MRFLPLIVAAGLSVVCMSKGEAQAKTVQPTPAQKKKTSEKEFIRICRDVTLKETEFVSHNENLKGITTVQLAIEDLPGVFTGIVSIDDLKTAIEIRCRSLGLRVVDDPSLPCLLVNITEVPDGNQGAAYNISVELAESTILVRDMKTSVLGTVWSNGGLALVGSSHLNGAEIKQIVVNYLDRFLNDWMKANGK